MAKTKNIQSLWSIHAVLFPRLLVFSTENSLVTETAQITNNQDRKVRATYSYDYLKL